MPPSAFRYTSSPGRRDDTLILKLSGPLTIHDIFSLQEELRQLSTPNVILDFTDTNYMDSAGLGVIMNTFACAEEDHRRLLLAGVNGRVLALLELTRVKQLLAIYPTVADAEASL